MKLTFTLESAKHRRDPSASRDKGPEGEVKARLLLEDAAAKVKESGASEAQQQSRRSWLGGAIAMFAALTGQDATSVLNDLGVSGGGGSSSAAMQQDTGLPVFREGRSTPAPPRHPGAQRPIQ